MKRLLLLVLVVVGLLAAGVPANADHTEACPTDPDFAIFVFPYGVLDGEDEGCSDVYNEGHCDLWVDSDRSPYYVCF